ncbi:MAG: hypothetical protein COA58_10665 [Bacteroidetes bacterium]|nr:MAG: hypothetical protein COA58_10665 [Bacteroidota bacterium]
MREIDNYFIQKDEPNKSCLLALRSIILDHDDVVTETTKWGMPCFCFKKKPFCYLWTDKDTNEPYILFVEGKYLNHPKLETGSRSRMKILRVNPNKDLQIDLIKSLLTDALNLYKNGTIVLK